jgi:hypothetical protein
MMELLTSARGTKIDVFGSRCQTGPGPYSMTRWVSVSQNGVN